jgi:hypothetical protein
LNVYKINKNISKTESNRAVESPPGKSLTVKINVSKDPVRKSDKERKTHHKNKKKTYQDNDCGRPLKDQGPNREPRINRACKPGTRTVSRNRERGKTYHEEEKIINPTGGDQEKETQTVREEVSDCWLERGSQ